MMRHLIDLMEQMRYVLLLEATARVAFLLKTYGAKLEAKFQAEPEPADIVAGVDRMAGETLPEKLVAYLLRVDPSRNQQNGQWLVVRYLKNALKLEDLERAGDVLEKYEAMKQARTLPPGASDINTVKSLADLFQIVKGTETGIVSADQAEQQAMAAQSQVLYDGPDCKILIPQTEAAACFFGRNTEWCTAWGDHQQVGLKQQGRHPGRSNRFASYAPRGALYIITLKGARNGEDVLLQYHSESVQFMDVDDRQVTTEYVRNLLKTYPVILKTIGEAKFAASHLGQLGISFFSPRALAQIKPEILIAAVGSRADFEALPDALKTTDFIVAYLYSKPRVAKAQEVVPQAYLTAEVAAALAQHFAAKGVTAAWDDKWELFELFPVAEWPAQTIEAATMHGRMGYAQFMQLPEDQRTPAKLHALIWGVVKSNPKRLAEFPKGLIADAGQTRAIVKHVPDNLQYLHDEDVSDDDILFFVQDWAFGRIPTQLAYLPPHRLVDPLLTQINSEFSFNIPPGDAGQALLKTLWAEKTAGSLESLSRMYQQESVPKRYLSDPAFWEGVLRAKATDHRRYSREGRNRWLRTFFETIQPEHVTPGMLDVLVTNYVGESDVGYWRVKLLALRKLWSEPMICTALKRKFLRPDDIEEDEITPAVAATLFRLDPTRQALTYQADDESLIREIGASSYMDRLIDHIPADRITEPVAFAAIEKAHVDTAKKRFPKAALSRRVFFAGVPYTFDLKDVPKKWRDDAMTVHAVSVSPRQLRYVPEPLAWLNAHPAIADDASPSFARDLEAEGFVAVKGGFQRITDLPAEKLRDGYLLYMADQPKRTARWFLRKGDTTIAKLEIKNDKLRLDNEAPAKDLEPVLRDIAQQFLTHVGDISILNKVGIYRNQNDRSVRDPHSERASQAKKLIDGIEWNQTAHLKGKLYTAWKGDTAILTAYTAPSGGWGGNWSKVQSVKLLDQPLGMANNVAIQKGFADMVSRNPENGRWDLMNIGIGYKDKWGYWIMTEQAMGKVGPFKVYYSPGQRVISIFGNKGLAAYCGLLMSGKVAREQVFAWLYPDDAKLLTPMLDATAAKIGPAVKAKSRR